MIRPALGYGGGANRIGFTALQIAVVAPMPRATVSTRDCRKARRVAKPARCIAQIRENRRDDVLPTGSLHLFADLRHAAQFESRDAQGVVRCEAASDVGCCRLLEVVLHLVGDVLVRGGSVGERAKAVRHLAP
jgi:hypothetical protein